MAEQKMRALQYSAFGGGAAALKHVDMPVPVPSKDEVLVKVEAASINPADLKIQAGQLKLILPRKLPHIPGTDIAGEVVALGPGVTSFAIGDKVLSSTDVRNGGALAEYAVVPIKTTAKRPGNISIIDGASLGCAGQTALQAVRDSARIKLDGSTSKVKNLLITAASGGVGSYAVQIAKMGGAHVTVTCGARNIALLKSLGADEVLDYQTPEGAKLQSPSGKKYDVVIHCACAKYQPFSTFKPQLAKRAEVIDLAPTVKGALTMATQFATFASQKFVPMIMSPRGSDLALLASLVDEGKLRTVVDSTWSLSSAEKAWEKLAEGHATGKIVVTMGDS